MRCRKCETENLADSTFCVECGAKLETGCPACGTENPPAAKFCRKCGTALVSEERTPDQYTPAHLAEKILSSKAALLGERKQVTVLFADIARSMELAEQVDAEEWHAVLDRFFTILAEGIHRFEGTINQFTGDGIMALFGAPIAHEDHALRACYAGLQIVKDVGEYAKELRRDRGLSFSVRLGINSGEVVLGTVGDDLSMDYTALGQTVGLASRVEGLAEPGRVYITEHTAALVTGFFEMDDLGAFSIKGVRDPVRVYEVKGAGAIRTRLDLARARGFSRFVGRHAEQRAGLVGLVDRGQARADAELPGGELHIRGGLAGVEHDRPADGRVGRDQHHAQRGARQVTGPVAQLREGFERDALLHRDEVPRLGVLGGLRAAPGVQDGADGRFGQRARLELANGALGADGFRDVHGSDPTGERRTGTGPVIAKTHRSAKAVTGPAPT
jgi:class 3 adenylate cyclase